MLLSVSHIHKAYGETVILPDVSFTMERGDHFALVGRNGSGKSTLLNIIVGDLRADEGVVSLEKDATVGYLPQYLDMVMEGSLYDFVLHAREDILEDEKKMASMEDAMKTASGDELNRLLEDYQSFSHIFEMKGGISYRSQVEGALFGLGFTREDFGRDTDTLSGGQKTRLSLARILMGMMTGPGSTGAIIRLLRTSGKTSSSPGPGKSKSSRRRLSTRKPSSKNSSSSTGRSPSRGPSPGRSF